MSEAPIGIFDSGLGGLSVWKACKDLLPQESFVYFADQTNCPYGPRPQHEIKELCHRIVKSLLANQAKLIVVACNTATAAAIKDLRKQYSLPFVGMEPAIKPAAAQSISKTIGILATEGTLKGDLFQHTKARYAEDVEVILQVGHGLVELVETGKTRGKEAEQLLEKFLLPMKARGLDQLVLGCTHYPFLTESIRKILGPGTDILDPAPAVAKQMKRILSAQGLLNPNKQQGTDLFYTNGALEQAQKSVDNLSSLLGAKIEFLQMRGGNGRR